MSKYPSVMIGTRVKNSSRWLDEYWSNIKKLKYPRKKIRIVFSYGKSVDNTLEKLKQYRDEGYYDVEIYREPPDISISSYGSMGSASIFSDYKELIDEDYFMLFDSDIVFCNPYLIREFIKTKEDIVGPYVLVFPFKQFYDTWIFRLNNTRFHPNNPVGLRLNTPIEVDSVGTCIFTRKDILKEVPVTNPYPELSFCNNARKLGYRVICLPYIQVFHIDPVKYNIVHTPLPANLGGYPKEGFACSGDEQVILQYPVDKVPATYDRKYWEEVKARVDKIILENCKKEYKARKEIRKYKSLKWLYNLRYFQTYYFTRDPVLQRLQFKLETYPEYFEIETTTICNMNCIMCENTYWKNYVANRQMTFEEFKYILDQFPNVRWIGMTGIGQHFTNPDYMKMVRYYKSDPDRFVEIFTPFLYMNEKRSRELIELGFDKIYVSIDASTKETYEIIRPNSDWNTVIKNIKRFDEIKKELDTPYFPRLCFHYILMSINLHEAIPFLEMLHEMDINVDFVQFSKILHPFKEIKHLYTDISPSFIEQVNRRARELGIVVRWNVDVTPYREPVNRCTAWTQPFIFVDGTVIPCCACNEQNDRIYQWKTSLGNIFKTSMHDIWYGKKYRRLRQMLYNNEVPPVCLRCPIYRVNT